MTFSYDNSTLDQKPPPAGMGSPAGSQVAAAGTVPAVTEEAAQARDALFAQVKQLPEAQQTALVGELAGLGTKDPDAITAYLTQRLDEITRAAPPVIEATPPPPSLAVATAAAPVPALQADNRQITVLSRNDFSSVVPEKESPYMGMGVPDVPDQGRLPCLDLCPPERNTALIAEMGQFRPQPDLPARAPSRDLGRTGAG